MAKAWNASAVLSDVRQQIERCKDPPKWRRCQLDKHCAKLLALRSEGASLAELTFWLKGTGVVVARSTVSRWLKRNGGAI